MASMHAVVKGRVQGVGFRWHVQRQAVALGLTGFVRNMPDGAVEVEAEGERGTLERFESILRRGPSLSRVDSVDVAWDDRSLGHAGFDITF